MLTLITDAKRLDLKRECEDWLRSHTPPQVSVTHNLDSYVRHSREWQAQLAEARLVGVHWPEMYGGRGLCVADEAIIQECLARAGSPQLINLFGLTMVGPVLLKHGTKAQQERYLKKILTAEEIWCQGFSEPGAGSDLAALSTQARKTETGDWQLTGQKIWTSFAHVADFCFLLARSDSESKRHRGLSYFLVAMRQAGVSIRPLVQITGESEFNEVFFDSASVSADGLVGEEGKGWDIAISTLMYERVILTFARHLQSDELLRKLGRVIVGLPENEPTRSQLEVEFGKLVAKQVGLRALALSHLEAYSADNSGNDSANVLPGPEGSLDKLAWSEGFQEIAEFPLRYPAIFADLLNDFLQSYLYSRGRTIAAGTSEIQRNVIAERLLNLPRVKYVLP